MVDNTPQPKKRSASLSSLRRHSFAGLALAVGLFGGLAAWASVTKVAGAVVASGLVAVQGGSQRVQHAEGGIVRQIFVRNEDVVEAGQLLIRLDDTTAKANLGVINYQLMEALTRQARLVAEASDAETIEVPPLLQSFVDQDKIAALMTAQDRLLKSRKAARDGQDAQLNEQISQIKLQISGIEAQQAAVATQLEIVVKEVVDLQALLDKGLTQNLRVNEAKRDQARLKGEQGRLVAEAASSKAAIAEREMAIEQADDKFKTEILSNLQEVGVTVSNLIQQKIAGEDRLARLEIRAPQAGMVHESIVQTVGGVVAPRDTLMTIVPQTNNLLVDARISPVDVDKMWVNQPVVLRLSTRNVRVTPPLEARVHSISPDLTREQNMAYFVVRIEVPADQLARLPKGTRFGPGMPAEVFAQTGEHTVLAYLLQPLVEQIDRTFRE